MFKLDASIGDAKRLAKETPARIQVGSTNWVTARFSAEEPLAKSLWKKWLKESYEITVSKSLPTKKKAKTSEKNNSQFRPKAARKKK